jgi:hypothetical protein
VDDAEDKDRKIRKLQEELVAMRGKFSQNHGKSGDSQLSPNKLIAILKSMGINASLGPDGTIVVNGKKFSMDDLGVADGQNLGEGSLSGGSHGETVRGKDSSGVGQPNVDKLQKTIKELKESNETYSMRAKERKSQIEEQAREIQKLSTELVKCRTTIKHKEFEYTTLLEEKERSLTELRAMLEFKHKEEIDNILKANHDMIKQQQLENEKIPQAVKEYTTMVTKISKQKLAIEAPLRNEFESHLKHVDKSRLDEIENIKKQYEYWLDEKDKALSGFVEAFNAYRVKKAEQLTMAEREIVRLYDYTEQIENILDDVEKGKFSVKQRQGATGGRSTTGILAATGGGGANDGTLGAIVLPKGLRPVNPLKIIPPGAGNGLELTKRIVEKHKERVSRLDKMKEDAFQKSLHYAAQSNATATGAVDDVLKQQVRDLLIQKSPRNNNRSNSPTKGRSGGIASSPTSNNSENNKPRPATIHGDMSKSDSFHQDAHTRAANSTAPGGFHGRQQSKDKDDWNEMGFSPKSPSFGEFPEELMQELQELREKVKNEQLTTQKVLNDLSSNETFAYIQKLEYETNRLRQQLKEVTNQLQSAKVCYKKSSQICSINLMCLF